MHVMKLTQDGKYVKTIGEPGVNKGSNDSTHLGGRQTSTASPRRMSCSSLMATSISG